MEDGDVASVAVGGDDGKKALGGCEGGDVASVVVGSGDRKKAWVRYGCDLSDRNVCRVIAAYYCDRTGSGACPALAA